jgi:hypothetical protein
LFLESPWTVQKDTLKKGTVLLNGLVQNWPGYWGHWLGWLCDGQAGTGILYQGALDSLRMSVRNTHKRKKRAREQIMLMSEDLWGTNTLTPLKEIYRPHPIPGHSLQVRITRVLTEETESENTVQESTALSFIVGLWKYGVQFSHLWYRKTK